MHYSKRLEYCFVCFISVVNVPRFQGFSNSEDSFVNYSGIIEVTGVIITPVLHILTFQMCSLFLVEKHLQPHHANVAPRTIGARNFIRHIDLKFNRRPKLEGREFLLQCLVWSSNNINSILSKMCEGFCDITNIWDSGQDGGFIFN